MLYAKYTIFIITIAFYSEYWFFSFINFGELIIMNLITNEYFIHRKYEWFFLSINLYLVRQEWKFIIDIQTLKVVSRLTWKTRLINIFIINGLNTLLEEVSKNTLLISHKVIWKYVGDKNKLKLDSLFISIEKYKFTKTTQQKVLVFKVYYFTPDFIQIWCYTYFRKKYYRIVIQKKKNSTMNLN